MGAGVLLVAEQRAGSEKATIWTATTTSALVAVDRVAAR